MLALGLQAIFSDALKGSESSRLFTKARVLKGGSKTASKGSLAALTGSNGIFCDGDTSQGKNRSD